MSKQTVALQLLVTLYRTASRGEFFSDSSLARTMGLELETVRELLHALDRAGYVNQPELRLTLSGLAVAVAAAKKQKQAAIARAA